MSSGYALRTPTMLTSRSFGVSFLREAPSEERKRSIEFHVQSDDYFGTIATVLGLLVDRPRNEEKAEKQLEDLRDELVYLQQQYKIRRK